MPSTRLFFPKCLLLGFLFCQAKKSPPKIWSKKVKRASIKKKNNSRRQKIARLVPSVTREIWWNRRGVCFAGGVASRGSWDRDKPSTSSLIFSRGVWRERQDLAETGFRCFFCFFFVPIIALSIVDGQQSRTPTVWWAGDLELEELHHQGSPTGPKSGTPRPYQIEPRARRAELVGVCDALPLFAVRSPSTFAAVLARNEVGWRWSLSMGHDPNWLNCTATCSVAMLVL